ncbi:hypothetical protein AMATHDRAFT_845 [Amanita thiersii Skay4041]|uniref:Acyl-CoA dehydrogenase/oxidase C-terminal domain-containing protein n=1 Tax=Amanita thiersii Skay4041 TaxID=703135 RepID=A0A2A9NVC9_9AGAR|nr:hypothetical protein AMATHDRAFT_845 [Amanita thiersii Skay4041]
MRVEQGFQPVPFKDENPYATDSVLPSLLKRTLPPDVLREVEPDLARLGDDILTKFRALSSGNKVNPPQLVQYDQWGRRVDELMTSEGWRNLKAAAQTEGIPGIFYERKYGEHSRSYGFAKMFIMVGDTHMVFCPLSMTDGAARVVELMGNPATKQDILTRLTSRDPSIALTSGQWMTERPGGSDLSQLETVAAPTGRSNRYGTEYELNGLKWFSSATDSDVSVALARTGSVQDGSRGLSLFLVPLRLPLIRNPSDPVPSPISNNIFIHRLKNKIGTQTLPTAELSLEGTQAYLLGPLNQGVKCISPVLNITRVWSAMSSTGALRKCLAMATAYAKVRAINGGQRVLIDDPLHVSQLASINLIYRALTHLIFGSIRLLGRSECNVATPDELRRLRLLTPVVKAFASEKACPTMEDAMTTLGGAGYMEENGFGRVIRDALVEKIWEGTTTVLALDIARAARDPAAIPAFITWAQETMAGCPSGMKSQVSESIDVLSEALKEIATSYQQPIQPLVPRPALMLMGCVASSIYLLEHANWAYATGEPTKDIDVDVFMRWVIEGGTMAAIADVKKAKQSGEGRIAANSSMVFGGLGKAKL